MNESLTKFIKSEAISVSRAAYNFLDKEREARRQMMDLASARRVLYHRCKNLIDAVKEDSSLKEVVSANELSQVGYFVEEYERDEANSPIVRLLNWSSMSGPSDESFVYSQIYDLLGKDDARTFRSLLREVVALADPKLAGDI